MSESESLAESDKSEDRQGNESAPEEAFLEEKEHIWDRTSPQLNSDPEEVWKTSPTPSKNNYQRQIPEDTEPPLLIVNTVEEEDAKPSPLSLTLHTDDYNPTPHSFEPPLASVADEDIKPLPLELMSNGEHANPSSLASMWEEEDEEEDVKPSPLDLLQITLHEQQSESGCGQAERSVNFWTTLEEEDSVSHSDEEPDSPASRVVISDGDSDCEPDSKSRRITSSESLSDGEWDLEHQREGRATKRSFQHLMRTQEKPPKAQRVDAGDWPTVPQKKWSSQPSPSDTTHWHTHEEEDIEPPPLQFMPNRRPGPQLSTSHAETPLDFFRLFFTDTVILTLLENTNAYGSQYTLPRDEWKGFSFNDMFSFLSLVIFMGLLKLPQLVDYWRTTRPYNIPFPPSVMTRAKFLNMCRSLQMCCLENDVTNQAVKGTKAYDRLGKIKPLFNQIVDACRTHFHPDQNLSINERMVTPNEGLTGSYHIRNKNTTGNKLVMLADAATGYTWNFTISEELKNSFQNSSAKGVAYDTVMTLMNVEPLGTGYHLYFDSFYTSPHLLKDLWDRNTGACGSFLANRMECLKKKLNDFPPNAPRGSIRWLREGELLFVKYKDTREVALCSTIHSAYRGDTVIRRLKTGDRFVHANLPIPPAVRAYNQHMEGDDSADGLIGFSSVLLKTKKWYRQFFYHFVDVAVVNAHILYNHCDKVRPMSQREFRDALVQQLADAGSAIASIRALNPVAVAKTHKAVYLYKGQDVPKECAATFGRRRCALCHRKTPVGCETCDLPLCFVPLRNCYDMWHKKHRL